MPPDRLQSTPVSGTETGVAGIILAGGKSRRMGFDKLTAEVGGAAMLQRVVTTLASFCEEVAIVGEGGPPVPDVPRVTGERSGSKGPLAGIEAGLNATGREVVFVCAGDLPFPNAGLAGSLLEKVRSGARAALPVYPATTPHPLFAAYRRDVREEAAEALDAGEGSVRAMLALVEKRGRVEYVREGLERFGEPYIMLKNVNLPEDLEAARKLAG